MGETKQQPSIGIRAATNNRQQSVAFRRRKVDTAVHGLAFEVVVG
jgi:hypothetical protein